MARSRDSYRQAARQALQPYLTIDRAVACIRERLTVSQLAACVRLSPRHLHRRFVETFGGSPQAFILKVRIQFSSDQRKNAQAHFSE